jgi:hypothetical protein
MSRLVVALLVLAVAGCATKVTVEPGMNVRDLAGPWRGRLAIAGANATASLTIKEDGLYTGTLHLEVGDRPFTGAIVLARPARLRYHGTHGDGTVVVTPRTGPPAALQFVPDGGGGGGSFTRAQ